MIGKPMGEALQYGLRQLREFFDRTLNPRPPHYIVDDYNLLRYIDPYLHRIMNPLQFQRLRDSLGALDSIVDIGAGSNFLRGLVLFDATHVLAIDPTYKWYGHQARGGRAGRMKMERLLRFSCLDLQIPSTMNPDGTTLIRGVRGGKQRSFDLVSEDTSRWLLQQRPQTIGSFVVYRVFPSPSEWASIISSLKLGGGLLTTGYGRPALWGSEYVDYTPKISQGGEADVYSSPLPASGEPERVGLEDLHLDPSKQVHLYRKYRHLGPPSIFQAISDNQYPRM